MTVDGSGWWCREIQFTIVEFEYVVVFCLMMVRSSPCSTEMSVQASGFAVWQRTAAGVQHSTAQLAQSHTDRHRDTAYSTEPSTAQNSLVGSHGHAAHAAQLEQLLEGRGNAQRKGAEGARGTQA
eukprot:3329763-Rhodomonas_salina.3